MACIAFNLKYPVSTLRDNVEKLDLFGSFFKRY